MKYLTENRIIDLNGKVWFIQGIKETKKDFWGRGFPKVGAPENILIAVSEKWAVDHLSDSEIARYRDYEVIEVPFKEIHIKIKPFKRIVNIIF